MISATGVSGGKRDETGHGLLLARAFSVFRWVWRSSHPVFARAAFAGRARTAASATAPASGAWRSGGQSSGFQRGADRNPVRPPQRWRRRGCPAGGRHAARQRRVEPPDRVGMVGFVQRAQLLVGGGPRPEGEPDLPVAPPPPRCRAGRRRRPRPGCRARLPASSAAWPRGCGARLRPAPPQHRVALPSK